MVTGKDVWEQKQIRRAVQLGVGKGKGDIKLVTAQGLDEFKELMNRVRANTGL
jgi:hypothetical protein